jgi:hypothetical protein
MKVRFVLAMAMAMALTAVMGASARIALAAAPTSASPAPAALAPSSAAPSPSSAAPSPSTAAPPALGAADAKAFPLLADRARFPTHYLPTTRPLNPDRQPPAVPPPGVYDLIHFQSPVGPLAAYLSPDPHDGKKHPAILWAHGGFTGIGSYFWTPHPADDDQTPAQFKAAGFVIMLPSRRGENDNPGHEELFFGEIDDTLAALDYLARQSDVDTSRIYMIGHSTGGTVALLTANCTHKLRAVFSLGGCPDINTILRSPEPWPAPFDIHNEHEVRVRSAIDYIDSLSTPTWFFEGDHSSYPADALEMMRRGLKVKAPFVAFGLKGDAATHMSIVHPVTQMILRKLQADTGPVCNVSISAQEVADAFNRMIKPAVAIHVLTAKPFSLEISTFAKMVWLHALAEHKMNPARTWLRLELNDDGQWHMGYNEQLYPAGYKIVSKGVLINASADAIAKLGPSIIDIARENGEMHLVVHPKKQR